MKVLMRLDEEKGVYQAFEFDSAMMNNGYGVK